MIFTFPPAAPKFSFFSPSLQRLGFFSVLLLCQTSCMHEKCFIVLICLSLIAADVNIFLMNLLSLQAYIFITERSVQVISISILLLKVIVVYFETFQVILQTIPVFFSFILCLPNVFLDTSLNTRESYSL